MRATAGLDTSTPLGFFTNLASRLIQSEFDLSLSHIEVYPTNQYTPAVHRLLQVTANIYDATTNRSDTDYPYLPSVFRPVFQKQGANLFIAGYEEVTNATVPSTLLDVPFEATDLAENLSLPDGGIIRSNIYNVPWVIGAKKGWPNFNEFAMQNSVLVERRLEFRRLDWLNGDPEDPANTIAFTNQLYAVGISNVLGIEAWNSYTSTFPRQLQVSVRNEVSVNLAFTNSVTGQGFEFRTNLNSSTGLDITPATWRGITNDANGNVVIPSVSFTLPLETNSIILGTNVVFLQSSAGFDGVAASRQVAGNTFPYPLMRAILKNRMRYFLLDTSVDPARVVDYVSLSEEQQPVNVTQLLMDGATGQVPDESAGGGWATNRVNNSVSSVSPTVGVVNQILASADDNPVDWNSYKFDPSAGNDKDKAIRLFKYQFLPIDPGSGLLKTNIFFAPLFPSRTVCQQVNWQANDPLVHYTISDLTDLKYPFAVWVSARGAAQLAYNSFRSPNNLYQPWASGRKGRFSNDPVDSDPANKDPLVYQSDDWQFPTDLLGDLTQIGQVHRGTPWQTIYLKSSDVDTNLDNEFWRDWTGNSNPADAALSRPVKDWSIAGLLVSLLNTNDPRQLLSSSAADTTAWQNTLNGIVVLTNNLSEPPLPGENPEFDQLVMTSNSPPAVVIASAIVSAGQTNPPLHSLGNVFVVPELSVASPWLNLSGDQSLFGISDDAYEAIPSQLLSLLRGDSVASITQSYGQLLIQFTTYGDHPGEIQVSSNLLDWVSISTNYPVNGIIPFVDLPAADSGMRFYRSVLLP